MNQPTEANAAERTGRLWLIAAFAVAITLQLELVFNRPVNWDEFYHLSETHAFAQGRLTEVLQVLYARLFVWIPALPLNAIDQIRVARVFMLGCELFATGAIYAIARHFAERTPAAIAALAYLTAGYVFQHGFSYRADPMGAALLMGALWILLASKLDAKAILGAAILAALAVLTTIKVVLYAPAFAGIAWLRWKAEEAPRGVLARLASFAVVAMVCSGLLVGLTMLSVPDSGHESAARTIAASSTIQFSEGLFPRWHYILGAMATAPLLALLIITAPFEIAREKLARPRWLALAGLMMPLASIALYRNSFPYFYAFILPPAMVGAAVAAKAMLKIVSAKVIVAALIANAAIVSLVTPREVLDVQRQTIAAVREVFPEPVAYFDFPGMIVDYPKANFFMTTWGMQSYWQGQFPSFVDVMAKETVPLLVVNQGVFERNQTGPEPAWELLPDDAVALREGFIPHWGPLWVAGRRFPRSIENGAFEIFAPGTYTLEDRPARIDGRDYRPGETMTLSRGTHHFERIESGEVVLRWGDHLRRPAKPFAGGPLFKDF